MKKLLKVLLVGLVLALSTYSCDYTPPQAAVSDTGVTKATA
tara:strand:- start:1089 stop:1211 length:123 start_codon:yes stop_codon:yes gene_type:complete